MYKEEDINSKMVSNIYILGVFLNKVGVFIFINFKKREKLVIRNLLSILRVKYKLEVFFNSEDIRGKKDKRKLVFIY